MEVNTRGRSTTPGNFTRRAAELDGATGRPRPSTNPLKIMSCILLLLSVFRVGSGPLHLELELASPKGLGRITTSKVWFKFQIGPINLRSYHFLYVEQYVLCTLNCVGKKYDPRILHSLALMGLFQPPPKCQMACIRPFVPLQSMPKLS